MPKKPQTTARKFTKQQLVTAGVIALAVLLFIAVILVHGQKSSTTTTVPTTIGPSPTAGTNGQGVNAGTPTGTPVVYTPIPTTAAPSASIAAPTGQLLSSSSISLSKNEAMESVCQTAINYTCTIILVSPSGKSVSIVAPATDGTGGHLVDWTPKQYASTVGTWKIYAQAGYNGQTANSPTYTFEVTQ